MKRLLYCAAFVLMLGGAAGPLFSQELLAFLGAGGQVLNTNAFNAVPGDGSLEEGIRLGVDVLFVGVSGFTISLGSDFLFNFSEGTNFNPVFGFGYVYRDTVNKFFVGSIVNCIPMPSIQYGGGEARGDGFITPTLMAGYDFGAFVLQAQAGFMYGIVSGIAGYRVSVGCGVNLWGVSASAANEEVFTEKE